MRLQRSRRYYSFMVTFSLQLNNEGLRFHDGFPKGRVVYSQAIACCQSLILLLSMEWMQWLMMKGEPCFLQRALRWFRLLVCSVQVMLAQECGPETCCFSLKCEVDVAKLQLMFSGEDDIGFKNLRNTGGKEQA